MTRTVALVTGVGPGTGSAIVKRFAQGPYEVAMIARSGERLRELAHDVPGTHAFAADVTDTHQMGEVLGRITRELGAPGSSSTTRSGAPSAIFRRSTRPCWSETSRSTSWPCCISSAARRRR